MRFHIMSAVGRSANLADNPFRIPPLVLDFDDPFICSSVRCWAPDQRYRSLKMFARGGPLADHKRLDFSHQANDAK